MPIVQVDMLEGRTEEQKRKIAEGICKALMEEGGAKKEAITITFRELTKENIAKGDKLLKDL